jgi:hypothetical protein
MHNLPVSKEAFFWAFSIASQVHRVPLATSILMHRHQPPYTLGAFRLVAGQRGLKVRQKAFSRSQVDRLPVPCLVALYPFVRSDVPVTRETAVVPPPEFQLALLQDVHDGGVVVVETCSSVATNMSHEVFAERFSGEAILFAPGELSEGDTPAGEKPARRSTKPPGESAAGRPNRPGLAWVIPSLDRLRAALGLTR